MSWFMGRVDKKGFTIIELMIVVAIIGIIATISIPNFLKYRSKAKQTEAKIQLKAIYTSELSYFSEFGYFTPDLSSLEWRPQTICTYRYTAGVGFLGNPDIIGVPMNAGTPGASSTSFTAIAYANIDNDSAIDTWQITHTYPLVNVYNDVEETDAL